MKRVLLYLPLIFSALQAGAFSNDTNSVKYFPLNIGNRWYYKTTFEPWPFPPIFHKTLIERDTIIAGKVYFMYRQSWDSSLIRIDSANGNLLEYSQGNGCGSYADDKIMDSLAAMPNGDPLICGNENQRCTGVGSMTVFGVMYDTKDFFAGSLTILKKTYAKNFGIIYSCGGDPDCGSFTRLIGCVIDGVVYGDTILSSISVVSNVAPDEYSLSQNFPNPFNPKTIIKYELQIADHVILKVFDVKGKEVRTLVNQKQIAGSYEVEFDGSGLASGIYFYRIEAGNFSETKRMILMK